MSVKTHPFYMIATRPDVAKRKWTVAYESAAATEAEAVEKFGGDRFRQMKAARRATILGFTQDDSSTFNIRRFRKAAGTAP